MAAVGAIQRKVVRAQGGKQHLAVKRLRDGLALCAVCHPCLAVSGECCRFFCAEVGVGVGRVPVQVAGGDGVGIDDGEMSHPCGSKPGRGSCRQSARAEDDDARAGKRFLRGGGHAGDFELAGEIGGVHG